MHKKNRPTIGFMVSGITDLFTEQLCTGVINEIRHQDANLVVIPVKYIDRDLSFPGMDRYEYQNKTLGSLLTKGNLDALIIAADCVGCLTTRENLLKFIEFFKDIPTVLVASRIDGYLSVSFNNVPGIYEGLRYMIEKLNCKKICMLGGPDDNTDAAARKRVYLNVLKEYELPFEERMFVEGDLTRMSNEQAGRLIDENPDADAIFCVNDDSALCLYEELNKRGMEPGTDVLVMGFDNSQAGAKAKIPLSTVDADPIILGKHAMRYVMKMLNGEVTESLLVPTRFLPRESIGKIEETISYDKERLMDKDCIDSFFDEIFYRYESIEEEDNSKLRKNFRFLVSSIIDYTSDHVLTRVEIKSLGVEIRRFLKNDVLRYTDTELFVHYVEKLFHAIEDRLGLPEEEREKQLELLLKVIIQAMDIRISESDEKLGKMLFDMKTHIKQILNFKYGNDQSYVNMVTGLYWLDMKNAFIYIYDDPVTHLEGEPFPTPEIVNLKAALVDDKAISFTARQQRIGIDDIFDNKYMKAEQKISVVMPIFFDEMVYGFAVCDMTDMVYRNGEFIANQFGAAARMIDLLKQNSVIQQQLEDSLAAMKENNIELDKMSKIDALTGIFNRRGFESVAERIINERMSNELDTVVSYVDMNNLKIINDRFGHEEGDFALQSIAEILKKVVGDDGIIARVGGDEFNFVYTGEFDESALSERFRLEFERFNLTSVKPYRVTASCGFARVKGGERMSLKAALELADRDLYKAKQIKDNVILKEIE